MKFRAMRIVAVCVIGLISSNVLAHSPLLTTTPKDGSTIDMVPAKVSLTFKKNIHLTKVSTTHNGEHSADLKLQTQTKFGTSFLLLLEQAGTGIYSVEWRGLGEDGHFLNGAFSFTVK